MPSNPLCVNKSEPPGHGDFVQASKLNRLNNFCPYWIGYISGKNWSFVIFYWLLILRSGTSPAPNYGEARGAESRADFVHKLRIAVKELNETGIWLLIILEARMAPAVLVEKLIKENRELACILGASIRTAQAKASRINK